MKLLSPKGKNIRSFKDWAEIFLGTKKAKHWKQGRSAWSIADYIMNHDGQAKLEGIVSSITGENVEFDSAMIEKESRFDSYGHGREHDLGIAGKTTSGKSVFIGLEAKVDESFGDRIKKSYLASKAKQMGGTNTNAPARIEELITSIFPEPKDTVFDLRYQLFYAVMGTLAEGADISILYVLVFKTLLYDELIGLDNYKDYLAFMLMAGAEKVQVESKELVVHKLNVGEKELICVYDYFYLDA